MSCCFYRELNSVGVKGIPSQGGYYFMPDFDICRQGFAKNGIVNGKDMCQAMLKEVQVAVSITLLIASIHAKVVLRVDSLLLLLLFLLFLWFLLFDILIWIFLLSKKHSSRADEDEGLKCTSDKNISKGQACL